LSDKVLTERLRELEQTGLVARASLPQLNGAAGYHLTDRGDSLREVLTTLYEWGETQSGSFGVSCGTPLSDLNNRMAAAKGIAQSDAPRPRTAGCCAEWSACEPTQAYVSEGGQVSALAGMTVRPRFRVNIPQMK